MQHKKNIIFDLDGTLINSELPITAAVKHVLSQFDIAVKDPRELRRFIGPPLVYSFQEYYDFSKEQAVEARELFLAFFQQKDVPPAPLYPGISTLIPALTAAGKTLAIATTKHENEAVTILKDFSLAKHFPHIGGSQRNGDRTDKKEIILYTMEQAGITSISDTVMVGDTLFDIHAATELGMDSVGVLYGFGSAKDFQKLSPTVTVVSVTELRQLLLPAEH